MTSTEQIAGLVRQQDKTVVRFARALYGYSLNGHSCAHLSYIYGLKQHRFLPKIPQEWGLLLARRVEEWD